MQLYKQQRRLSVSNFKYVIKYTYPGTQFIVHRVTNCVATTDVVGLASPVEPSCVYKSGNVSKATCRRHF